MLNILIIDDDAMFASYIYEVCARFFKDEVHVDIAVTHEQLDTKLQQKKYHLYVVDLHFEKRFDGIETIKILRSKEHDDYPYVIINTAALEELKQSENYLLLGADQIISKTNDRCTNMSVGDTIINVVMTLQRKYAFYAAKSQY